MPYTYNIPQATDQLSVSQGQILANFTSLGAIAGNANVASSTLNNLAGFNFVSLANQVALDPTLDATHMAIYAKNSANTGQEEMWIARQTGATGISPIEFTSCLRNSNGWTYLPSGIILQWGRSVDQGGAGYPKSLTQNFAITFPTACYVVVTQMRANGGSSDTGIAVSLSGTPTTTQFTVYLTQRSTAPTVGGQVWWYAIGS